MDGTGRTESTTEDTSPTGAAPLAAMRTVGQLPTPSERAAPEPPPRLPAGAIADLHVDTITAMEERGLRWSDPSLEAGVPALRAGGVQLVVQAAWIPRDDPSPHATALRKLDGIAAMVAEERPWARIVGTPAEARAHIASGGLAVVLGLEGGTALLDAGPSLDALVARGLRVVGPTWTARSPWADSSAEAGTPPGLTPAGRTLVERANALGLLIDVSHMSDTATADTLEHSRAPVMASHSNCRAVAAHERNLPDDLIRRIAAGGGLVGAMFHAPFVRPGGGATVADVVRHLDHLRSIGGPGVVGIGSDWDGRIRSVEGLGSARALPSLLQALGAAGWTAENEEAARIGNALRLWERVVAAASAP